MDAHSAPKMEAHSGFKMEMYNSPKMEASKFSNKHRSQSGNSMFFLKSGFRNGNIQ